MVHSHFLFAQETLPSSSRCSAVPALPALFSRFTRVWIILCRCVCVAEQASEAECVCVSLSLACLLTQRVHRHGVSADDDGVASSLHGSSDGSTYDGPAHDALLPDGLQRPLSSANVPPWGHVHASCSNVWWRPNCQSGALGIGEPSSSSP